MQITKRPIFSSEDPNTSSNIMTINVFSGINSDGFVISVDDADGRNVFKQEYYYGYNASYDRKFAEWAEKDRMKAIEYKWDSIPSLKPYAGDIIDDVCKQYHINKSDIRIVSGRNVFIGNNVNDSSVQSFIDEYITASTYMRKSQRIVADDEDVDDLEHPDQEFDSAATSINSNKLPAIYRMITLEPGTVGIDFGGGRFDNAVLDLKDKGVTLCVYDPYNRSKEHNDEMLRVLRENGGADFAINSNVLNVIKEPEARLGVLRNIKKLTKPGAPIYITVYEGKGDGNEGPTKSGYQLNRRTEGYLDEVREVFPDAVRKGKLIKATNSGDSVMSSRRIRGSRNGYDYDYSYTCDRPSGRYAVYVTEAYFGQDDDSIAQFNDFEASISKLTSYDEADYYWAQIGQGTIRYYKGSKLHDKSHYMTAIDWEMRNDEWAKSLVNDALDTLDELNSKIAPQMIHNSKKLNSRRSYVAASKYRKNIDTNKLLFDLKSALHNLAASPEWGIASSEVWEYFDVRVYEMTDMLNTLQVEVNDYLDDTAQDLLELCHALDVVIRKYDPEAYFQVVDTQMIAAYVSTVSERSDVDSSTSTPHRSYVAARTATVGSLKHMKVHGEAGNYSVRYTVVDTSQDADVMEMFKNFEGYVSLIAPYDDAPYMWARIKNGVVTIYNGATNKPETKSYYFNADDMDVENDEWCDTVVQMAIESLDSYNTKIEPRMIHNSTQVDSNSAKVVGSESLEQSNVTDLQESAERSIYSALENLGWTRESLEADCDMEVSTPDPSNPNKRVLTISCKNGFNEQESDAIDSALAEVGSLYDPNSTVGNNQLWFDFAEANEEPVMSSLDVGSLPKKLSSLISRLKSALRDVMTSYEFGFDFSDEGEYYDVHGYVEPDNRWRIEVAAEVSYDATWTIIDKLDPILRRVDEDSYLEQVDSGIMEAYVNPAVVTASSEIEGASEPWIGVPEPPDVYDADDVVESFEISAKDVPISVGVGGGNWEFDDDSWANNPEGGDSWYGENTGVYLTDSTGIVESIMDMLEPFIPIESGDYLVGFDAELVFNVEGLETFDRESTDLIEDSGEAKYDAAQSRIYNIVVSRR